MSTHDYLPTKDGEFLIWGGSFLQNLQPQLTRFGIAQDKYNTIKLLYDDFTAAMATVNNPETYNAIAVERKNLTRKAFETALRAFIQEHLTYNSAVTDIDRKLLELPIHKTGHTPTPAPITQIDAKVKVTAPGIVEISFQDATKENKAKPFGVRGAEIAHAILEAVPTSREQLIHSSFDTASPFRLEFDLPDRGKTLYFCLRWENTTGEKGPWNEIQSAIIP